MGKKKKKPLCDLNSSNGLVHDFCPGFGSELLGTIEKSLYLWKMQSHNKWKINTEIILKNPMEKIIFLPSCGLIISVSSDEKKLYLWSNREKKIFFSGKMNMIEKINSIERSTNSNFFALSSSNGRVSIFSQKGALIQNFSEKISTKKSSRLYFRCLKWFDNKILLTGGTDKKITALDIRMKKKVKTFKGHTSDILGLENTGDENTNHWSFFSSDSKGVLKLWDIRSQKEVCSFKIPYFRVYSLGQR